MLLYRRIDVAHFKVLTPNRRETATSRCPLSDPSSYSSSLSSSLTALGARARGGDVRASSSSSSSSLGG
jgi:hypothetical protein